MIIFSGSEQTNNNATNQGPANLSQVLQLTIYVLRDANEDQLNEPFDNNLFRRSKIRNYRANRYGTALNQIASALSLTIISKDISGRRLILSGTVDQINRAFNITLNNYLDDNGSSFISHEGPHYLPDSLLSVVEAVFGLNTRKIGQLSSVNHFTIANTSPWYPAAIAQVYGMSETYDGTGQTIGIVAATGFKSSNNLDISCYDVADVNFFRSQMGYSTSVDIADISVDGVSNNSFGKTGSSNSSEFEWGVDILSASTIAPGARIRVYWNDNTVQGWANCFQYVANDSTNNPTILTMSLAQSEQNFTAAQLTSLEASVKDVANAGITFFVATGDWGQQNTIFNSDTSQVYVNYPASSAWLTAVGGTTLTVANNVYGSEKAWSSTGSGVSRFIPKPTYQNTVTVPTQYNTGFVGRGIPDLSVVGDVQYQLYSKLAQDGTTLGFYGVGGTSVSAPVMAGITARINQQRGISVGFLNPTLYNISSTAFRDITTGDNRTIDTGGGPTVLSTKVTLTNPAGQPTQTNPFFTFGLPIPRSLFPSSGYKLALYDSAGTTKISDLQVDQTTKGWKPDNSFNYAVVSGYASNTTLAASATATFTIKAETGTIPTTQVCTLTTLAANSDIKAVCKIGTDTFTVSANTIIAATPSTTNPQTYVRQWKLGPYAGEWCLGGYLKRDSDGAFHLWAFLKLYITALSKSGPFIVRGYLENPNSYGSNAAGTVGTVATAAPPVTVDSIDIFNGTTLIGSIGGVNDVNNGTFAPSNVDLPSGSIAMTFQGGLTSAGALSANPRCSVGFVTTGTLPGGLGSASTTTYWATRDPANGNIIPCLSRVLATRITWGGFAKIAAPTSGTSVAINKWIYANGGAYYSSTAGVSTGTLPTGATFADNSAGGTLVWTLLTAQITSQGTGTHTMVLKSTVSGGSKVAIAGSDTYPFWNGTGSLPKLLIGYDRDYMVRQTKAVLPLDPSITPSAWVGALPRYSQNMTYLPGAESIFFIGDGGESTMDERINMFSPTALTSICLPTDAGMAMSCRLIALSWVDRQTSWRDERTHEIPILNYGPDRLGASYPGMPPTNSTLHCIVIGSGSPKMIGWSGWNGYGGSYSDSATADPSHCPNAAYWPALTSGDPMFFDELIEHANFVVSASGSGQQFRSAVFNGVNMTWAWPFFTQPRGAGHTLQAFSQCEWIWPDAHPAKQYLVDVMDDSAAIGPLWTNANVGTNGQSVGFIVFNVSQPTGNSFWQEPWMIEYLQMAMMQEVLKGNRAGFKSFLENYFWKAILPIFDSDVGGSERVAGIQWSEVSTNTAANPPVDANFVLTAADRLAGNPVVFTPYTTIPPPSALFVNGLQTSQSTTYVYFNPGVNGAAWPANNYGMTLRALCEMGAMAGITVYQKIADRINALLTLSYKGIPCNYTLQGPGSGGPTGTSPGNNNGLMYAMKRQ